jgi:ribosomal RNA-processing protein 9
LLYYSNNRRTSPHECIFKTKQSDSRFGHQDRISGIDAGVRERCVSAGGRDGTVRVWKIVEESQLIFNGPATSIDVVKLINEEHFVTCGEDG